MMNQLGYTNKINFDNNNQFSFKTGTMKPQNYSNINNLQDSRSFNKSTSGFTGGAGIAGNKEYKLISNKGYNNNRALSARAEDRRSINKNPVGSSLYSLGIKGNFTNKTGVQQNKSKITNLNMNVNMNNSYKFTNSIKVKNSPLRPYSSISGRQGGVSSGLGGGSNTPSNKYKINNVSNNNISSLKTGLNKSTYKQNEMNGKLNEQSFKRTVTPNPNSSFMQNKSNNSSTIKKQLTAYNQPSYNVKVSKGKNILSNFRSQTPNLLRNSNNITKPENNLEQRIDDRSGIGNIQNYLNNKKAAIQAQQNQNQVGNKVSSSNQGNQGIMSSNYSKPSLNSLNKSEILKQSKSIPTKTRSNNISSASNQPKKSPYQGIYNYKGIASNLVKTGSKEGREASHTPSPFKKLGGGGVGATKGNFLARNYSPNITSYKMKLLNKKSQSKSNIINQDNSKSHLDSSLSAQNSQYSDKKKGNVFSNMSNHSNISSASTQVKQVYSKINHNNSSNYMNLNPVNPQVVNINNHTSGSSNTNHGKVNNTTVKSGKMQIEFSDDQSSETKNPSKNYNQMQGNQGNPLQQNNNNLNQNYSKINQNVKQELNFDKEKENSNRQNKFAIADSTGKFGGVSSRQQQGIQQGQNQGEVQGLGKSAKEILKENDTSPFSHFHWKKIDNTKQIQKKPTNDNSDFSPSKYVGVGAKLNVYNFNGVKQLKQDPKKFNVNNRISLVEQQQIMNNPRELGKSQENVYSKKNITQNQNLNEEQQDMQENKNQQVYNKAPSSNNYTKPPQNQQEQQIDNGNLKPKITSLEEPSGSNFIDGLFNSPELKSLLTGNVKKDNQLNNQKELQSKFNEINQSTKKNISPTSNTTNNNNKNMNSSINNSTGNNNVNMNNSVVRKKIKALKELTKTGYNGTETKKNNQDIAIIHPNFMGVQENFFLSVCDGHGVYGHDVSRYIKSTLPGNLEKEFKLKNLNVFNSEQKTSVYKSIEDMFNFTNYSLNNSNVDTEFSGSTCVSMFYSPSKVVTANIGDSRVVLGKLIDGGKSLIYISLNRMVCQRTFEGS